MSAISALISLARRVVESVKAELMKQLNVVEEQAHAPIQAMVQQVVGGVWKGEGANAFVEEVSGLVIPGVKQTSDHILRTHRNIDYAVDVIDRADEEVSRMAQALGDVFGGIY